LESPETMRELAAALLDQSERCALAGLLHQAEAILTQTWTIAAEPAPDLANAAAWELAWLLVRREAYAEAIEWFHRIGAPLVKESLLWPAARQAIVRICLGLANKPSEPADTPPRSPQAQSLPAHDQPSPELPMLTVRNLGRFQVTRAEVVLPICTAHNAVALFRYLLTRHDHMASKEELMELLWPEAQSRAAANRLHVAVSTLRRHLDSPRGSYLLFEDDCSAFQQLSAQGEQRWRADDLPGAQQVYTQALTWYHGDYYVDTRDLLWAINVQEQLLSRYLTMLDHLGQIYITQRRFDQAAGCYQRLLERDSYREDGHAQLMRCYLQLGRRGDALRQYERCVAILAKDLGLEPMWEIQELYHAIQTGISPDTVER
jgi:DNA-binding SARP family transcriptional activator